MKPRPPLPPPSSRASRLRLPALLLVLVGLLATVGTPAPRSLWELWERVGRPQRVHDRARILAPGVEGRAEEYTASIFNESDVDVRLVLLRTDTGEDLEEVAPRMMRDLDAGASGGQQRGLLIVYDARTRRGRIEVGYGLEEHFPDGFVGYLLTSHVEPMFAAGNTTQGVHLLLRILHHRIREAVLQQRFDPRVLDALDKSGHLSGGAGASRALPIASKQSASENERVAQQSRARFAAQKTPEEAYRAYLDWLIRGTFDPSLEVFTAETREYLSSLPMTPGYFEYILLQEYGQPYEMFVRDDRALLVFTRSPLVCPHFFVRTAAGWQIDLMAEVANTANIAGGVYTWSYRGENDRYTNRFADKLIKIKNYMRLIPGDNRMLPMRNPAKDPSAPRKDGRRDA